MASQFDYGSIIITFADHGSKSTILLSIIYRSDYSLWRNWEMLPANGKY
ncbi:hypothetical protein OVZ80_002891 [Listeria monocytogenes]|nr:hypothetical protein [Listeria monocytogenes]EIZ6570145.1 hypothetical protein [Listeria monocytogenes]EKE5668077.1 hypothetical protein [Listeria monocytogenes]EKP9929678.1 hypothetical protein [Listeria monocytogenes]